MFYDPGIKVETKPVLRRFITWLKTKPARQFYDWKNTTGCACAQFYQETYPDVIRRSYDWVSHNRTVRAAEGVDINVLAGRDVWTYGALLRRCQEALVA